MRSHARLKFWDSPEGALRGSRTVQDAPRGIWRAPGGAGSLERALGGQKSRTVQDGPRGIWRAPGGAGSLERALGGQKCHFTIPFKHLGLQKYDFTTCC